MRALHPLLAAALLAGVVALPAAAQEAPAPPAQHWSFDGPFGSLDLASAQRGFQVYSVERVWSELTRVLSAPDPRAAVGLMATLGVLAAVLPEGADPARLARLIEAGAPVDPLLRLAALLTGDPAVLAARLRLSAAERDRLVALRTGPVPRPGDDDAALRRLLADEPREVLIDRAWLAGDGGREWAVLRTRLSVMPRPVFPLEGRDVLALGEPEGPRVGALLRAVRQWWLHGGCVADKEACHAELVRRRWREL